MKVTITVLVISVLVSTVQGWVETIYLSTIHSNLH